MDSDSSAGAEEEREGEPADEFEAGSSQVGLVGACQAPCQHAKELEQLLTVSDKIPLTSKQEQLFTRIINKRQKESMGGLITALNPSDDDADLHPPFVCKPCEVMLKKW